MDDLNDFRLFAIVVGEGGFAAAARRMGIPRSQVSRRIQGLEDRFGLRLVHRTPHSFTVTDIGREFYTHCLAMLSEAEAASEVIQRQKSEPQGMIRVSCPSPLIYGELGAMVADFMVLYPKVVILLESTNRRVDVLREGYDMAIRLRFPPLEDSDLILRRFGVDHHSVVCAPRLLEDYHIETVEELGLLPSLSWNVDQPDPMWQLYNEAKEERLIRHSPRLLTQDMATLVLAAQKGLGACQLPRVLIREALLDGSLIEPFPQWRPRSAIIHAAFATRRGMLPGMRAFLDFLAMAYELRAAD